ncbi:MAG: UDP-glucose 4-epimerase [Candidatus Wallbacteria bacterium HGW-Wallbacteria-1]|jgi:UDP-glucose 4-epimerase|uniref:UDP-glucose 4-epimerase n=1 Tax=Candidatus Wallbacteria bacterium HGW-Wallbacteria-1 TaxID=2013854 RepID=A0A2N1PQJ9_9BACT|nr:MAG: UDP-glucose 4-epimerase [Candidatus Wallbacteria bacterium HGW-Wallbacteria-1]
MSKILVTGGAGFIGSHIVDRLLEMNHDIIVLDDLSGGFIENVNPRATFIEGTITCPVTVGALFEKYNFEYVYHLAAYAAEGLSHFIKKFNYENNLIGSVNLINASINSNVKCFIFTSSIAVYGKNQLPMTEELTPLPEDPYGIAKLAVEQELAVSKEMFGLDYVIFRPHNVYGERQNIGDKYRNVIGIFMNNLMKDEALPVFGDGGQTRAFTYIDDIAAIIASSPFTPEALGQTFNIGSDIETEVADLAAIVADSMNKPLNLKHLPERKEVRHAYADHSKARKVFGNLNDTALKHGIARMAQWAQSVGSRKSQNFKGIEITKNLPPSWSNQ